MAWSHRRTGRWCRCFGIWSFPRESHWKWVAKANILKICVISNQIAKPTTTCDRATTENINSLKSALSGRVEVYLIYQRGMLISWDIQGILTFKSVGFSASPWPSHVPYGILACMGGFLGMKKYSRWNCEEIANRNCRLTLNWEWKSFGTPTKLHLSNTYDIYIIYSITLPDI